MIIAVARKEDNEIISFAGINFELKAATAESVRNCLL